MQYKAVNVRNETLHRVSVYIYIFIFFIVIFTSPGKCFDDTDYFIYEFEYGRVGLVIKKLFNRYVSSNRNNNVAIYKYYA